MASRHALLLLTTILATTLIISLIIPISCRPKSEYELLFGGSYKCGRYQDRCKQDDDCCEGLFCWDDRHCRGWNFGQAFITTENPKMWDIIEKTLTCGRTNDFCQKNSECCLGYRCGPHPKTNILVCARKKKDLFEKETRGLEQMEKERERERKNETGQVRGDRGDDIEGFSYEVVE